MISKISSACASIQLRERLAAPQRHRDVAVLALDDVVLARDDRDQIRRQRRRRLEVPDLGVASRLDASDASRCRTRATRFGAVTVMVTPALRSGWSKHASTLCASNGSKWV